MKKTSRIRAVLTPSLIAAIYPLFFVAHNLTDVTAPDAFGILYSGLVLAICSYLLGFCVAMPLRLGWVFALRAASIFALGILCFVGMHSTIESCNGWIAAGILLVALLWLRLVPASVLEGRLLFFFGLCLSALNMGLLLWGLTSGATYYATPLIQQAVAAYEKKKPELPNVLYIIPDRYPNAQTLQRDFGFSNSEFLSSLTNMGFHLRNDSYANYTTTFPSLTSVLNMDYLPQVVSASRYVSNENYLIAPFNNNAAMGIFNAIGYRTTFMGGAWNTLHSNASAQRNLSLFMHYEQPVSNYVRVFIDATPLRFLFRGYFWWKDWSWINGPVGGDKQMWCNNIKFQEKAVPLIMRDEAAPQFVFWHLYLPHPPYIHDSQHEQCLNIPIPQNEAEEKHAFLEQLIYANKLLLRVAHTAQEASKRPLVIVFQSDEGPYPWRIEHRSPVVFSDMNEDELQFKFGNFNAIYMSAPSGQYFMPATPVNNFRVLFNSILGTNFPMLDDQILLKESDMQPNAVRDITGSLIH